MEELWVTSKRAQVAEKMKDVAMVPGVDVI